MVEKLGLSLFVFWWSRQRESGIFRCGWGNFLSGRKHAEWIFLGHWKELQKLCGVAILIERDRHCYYLRNQRTTNVRDSLLVIREAMKLVKNYKIPSSKMHHIFISLINEFNAVNFLHILRENNQYADQMENSGVELNYGCMISNGNTSECCWVPWHWFIFVFQPLNNSLGWSYWDLGQP